VKIIRCGKMMDFYVQAARELFWIDEQDEIKKRRGRGRCPHRFPADPGWGKGINIPILSTASPNFIMGGSVGGHGKCGRRLTFMGWKGDGS